MPRRGTKPKGQGNHKLQPDAPRKIRPPDHSPSAERPSSFDTHLTSTPPFPTARVPVLVKVRLFLDRIDGRSFDQSPLCNTIFSLLESVLDILRSLLKTLSLDYNIRSQRARTRITTFFPDSSRLEGVVFKIASSIFDKVVDWNYEPVSDYSFRNLGRSPVFVCTAVWDIGSKDGVKEFYKIQRNPLFLESAETLSVSLHPAFYLCSGLQHGSEALHDLPLSLSNPHSPA